MERANNRLGISEKVYAREAAQSLVLPAINEVVIARLILVVAMAAGIFLRIWQIDAMGFNTDEAVYAGQAAAIARVAGLRDIFPIFRAHPLLFQFMLSIVYRIHFSDLLGRLLAVAISLGTVFLVYKLGKTVIWEVAGCTGSFVPGIDAVPCHRFPPGTPGWTNDLLRHTHFIHVSPLWKDAAGCLAVRCGWVYGLDLFIQGNQHHYAWWYFCIPGTSSGITYAYPRPDRGSCHDGACHRTFSNLPDFGWKFLHRSKLSGLAALPPSKPSMVFLPDHCPSTDRDPGDHRSYCWFLFLAT